MTCCRDINDQKPTEKRCMCLPYNEPWLFASQIMSILIFAPMFSLWYMKEYWSYFSWRYLDWSWSIICAINFVPVMLLQVLWCRRKDRVFVTETVPFMEFVTRFTCFVGFMVYFLRYKDLIRAMVLLISGVFWMCFVCCFKKFRKEKYDLWEEKYNSASNNDAEDDVELGTTTSTEAETGSIPPSLPEPMLPEWYKAEPMAPLETHMSPEHVIDEKSQPDI